jgi:LysR family transcriptional regulator, nod-box dependent transcriptional activator
MRLDQFDLNLLIAFDALMKERNVTTAAKRVNLTQSAMSAALKRLRESLADDLLIQHGKKMIPTERALQLAPEVAEVLQSLRKMIAGASDFTPASSQRRFRIAASDYISTVLLAPLIRELQQTAPLISLDISLADTTSHQALDNGELDLILQPEEFAVSAHPTEFLWEERFVVLGCRDNPALNGDLSIEQFYECGHIAVEIDGFRTFVDAAVDRLEPQRRVDLVAPSFLTVPWLLSGTQLLALVHERLGRLVARQLPLAFVDCPVTLPTMREVMQFHSTRSTDQGLCWLRNSLKRQSQILADRDSAA